MRTTLGPVLGALLVVAACGGASNQDLFAPEGSSTFGTDPSSSSSGNSSSGGASSGSSSSSGGSSSSGSSGASSSSSGSSGSSSGSSSGDHDGGSTSPVFCGNDTGAPLYCSGANKLCCEETAAPAPPFGSQFGCVADTSECTSSGGIPILCSSKSSCPGSELCCGTFDQNLGYTAVQCQASCTPSTPNTTSVRFCDGTAAKDECVGAGKKCSPSTSLAGFYYCK